MKFKKVILSSILLALISISSTTIQAQEKENIFDKYEEFNKKMLSHVTAMYDNYIHVYNNTNDEIFVEYDHDLIKRKYYGTVAPAKSYGKPYRPFYQHYDYTVYVRKEGTKKWSQHHVYVNCKKKSQLVTITKKNGDYEIKVTEYKR